MRGLLRAAPAVVAVALSALALAETPPVGKGTPLASGSKVTSAIYSVFEGEDLDHYVFDGYAGQVVNATVTAPKGSALLPSMELLRPDGTTVSADDGAKVLPRQPAAPGRSVKLAYRLDATGVWTVRLRGGYRGSLVRGDNPATPGTTEKAYVVHDFDAGRTTGAYAFTLKYGTPPASASRSDLVGAGETFRFVAPAAGGTTLSASLTFAGGTPLLVSVVAPDGRAVNVPSTYVTTRAPKGRRPGVLAVAPYALDASLPLGGYRLTFENPGETPLTKVAFRSSVKVAAKPRPAKGPMSPTEPIVESVTPSEGGPDVAVSVRCSSLGDQAGSHAPRVFLGRIEMEDVVADGALQNLTFTTPADLPDGTYDVTVLSTTGQAGVLAQGFRVVPPPVAETLTPTVGSSAGQFTVTITGRNFSTAANGMRVGFRKPGEDRVRDAVRPPVTFQTPLSETRLSFTMPGILLPGTYVVHVENARTGRASDVPETLTLADTAAISRVVPGLVPILGGDTMYVHGANFTATDRVFLETSPGSGAYEEVPSAFVSATLLTYTAPVRPKGAHRVLVEDVNGYRTPTRACSYYRFVDFTATTSPAGADGYDAHTSALADFDGDGDEDLFLSRVGDPAAKSATTLTRVFRNDGTGALVDVTSAVMPAVTADDDWRAHRVRVADVDVDGFPDLVLATNSDRFPTSAPDAGAKSHVRFLMNERNAATGERRFRDRTSDLAPPPRALTGGWGVGRNDVDEWRALDLWVGDVDQSSAGPPEVVLTNDRVLENYYVYCAPYCASPYAAFYTYSFYWGGTRVFKWDPTARSGLGRYKVDRNYFPRRSGITVPIVPPPPGVIPQTCTPNQCRGTFVPFTGQHLAVGDLDADGRPDFAVANSGDVTVDGAQISSLQVAINRVRGGAQVWDVTADLTGIHGGTWFKADAVAVGRTGYLDPAGEGWGVIALARADATGLTTSAMTLVRAKAPSDPVNDVADFETIAASFPPSTAGDRYHASFLEFVDVDEDGDDDLLSLARTAPPGGGPAFRVFRNEARPGEGGGFLTRALDGLLTPLVTASERFEGVALSVGDLDGDGAREFVISRDGTAGGSAPHTRTIRLDK